MEHIKWCTTTTTPLHFPTFNEQVAPITAAWQVTLLATRLCSQSPSTCCVSTTAFINDGHVIRVHCHSSCCMCVSGQGQLHNIIFSKQMPIEGDDIEITCNVTDIGNPTVDVYLTNQNNDTVGQNVTTLSNITREQAGVYSCHMNNSVSHEVVTKRLHVACKYHGGIIQMGFISQCSPRRLFCYKC